MAETGAFPDKELSHEFERLREVIPEIAQHRQALKILGADYTFIRKNQDKSWTTLISPGQILAGRFGLTRDLMLVYSEVQELQPSVLSTFRRRRDALPRSQSCEDHFLIVSSRDPAAPGKLIAWMQDEPVLGIHMRRDGSPDATAAALLGDMRRKLASRNLYDETLPVTGDEFFGRRRELTQLQEELRQGKVCGVFGLRKSGKTSLIKELGQRFTADSERRIFVLRDLESLPSQSPRLRIEVVQELRQGFLEAFKSKNVRRGDLADLELDASVGAFKRALKTSLNDCERKDIQVVLALDEIEFLIGDADTLDRGSRPEVPEILGALRSLVQEHSAFNVVLSGITSAIIHRGDLYGAENPLFNWARAYYIQPMSQLEIDALTVDVGRRMAVTWSPAALDSMYARSRGNVFLHRTLAAVVADRANELDLSISVKAPDVQNCYNAWRRGIAERLDQMYRSFERHYPTESSLLRMVAVGDSTWAEIDGDFPAEVSRLMELSLVEESPDGTLALGPLAQTLKEARIL